MPLCLGHQNVGQTRYVLIGFRFLIALPQMPIFGVGEHHQTVDKQRHCLTIGTAYDGLDPLP